MISNRMVEKGFTLVEIMIVVGVIGIIGAIAMPNYAKARRSSQSTACIANLRQIDHSVQMWAVDVNKPDTSTPIWDDLVPLYMRTRPSCPAQGTYTLGPVNGLPTCSLGDAATKEHILPT